MRHRSPTAALIALALLLSGCSQSESSIAPTATSTERPGPPAACPPGDPSPRPAEAVDAGTPPPAPTSVELTAGPHADQATVRVRTASDAHYDAVQLRVLVDGCAVPYTDEGDELPTHTITGLHRDDHVEVLARLDGEGGHSAETSSTPLTIP